MSLKIEEKLIGSYFTEIEPVIYTTGAYLVPMEIKVNEEKYYVWVVNEFEDDSFDTNGKFCSPRLLSCKKDNLIQCFPDDIEL
ncbi:MAG: hypothetical protein FJ266_03260 [Planctomycetes bacterium]|nr:hypothetical protein [Planctomycetota bacterium]